MSKEMVNHPEHYNRPGRKECIEEFIDKYGPEYTYVWCLMTADKYEYRKGNKEGNPIEQEEGKIAWYRNKADEIKQKYELKETH